MAYSAKLSKKTGVEGSFIEESSEGNIERETEMLDCSLAEEFPRPGKVINVNKIPVHAAVLGV